MAYGKIVEVLGRYDDEWGYSNRTVYLGAADGGFSRAVYPTDPPRSARTSAYLVHNASPEVRSVTPSRFRDGCRGSAVFGRCCYKGEEMTKHEPYGLA